MIITESFFFVKKQKLDLQNGENLANFSEAKNFTKKKAIF
jgi:hypothetical protein